MTEKEWLACTDPAPMLELLRTKGSERKVRLVACACCRTVWNLLADERGRTALETAERYADGLASKADLRRSRRAVRAARHQTPAGAGRLVSPEWLAYWAVEVAATEKAYWHTPHHVPNKETLRGAVPAYPAALVREVLGPLPFRPIPVDPAWLHWHDGAAVRIAQTIYEERRFRDLPILADALEEAGCTDPDLLRHCRGPAEHVRGCWAVDLILERS